MATSEQIKLLLESHYKNDDDRFTSMALQVVAHEARKGNMIIAKEIKSLVDRSKTGGFKVIRLNKNISDLVLTFYPENRINELVLSESVKKKLERILKSKVSRVQIKEFPNLRKKYAKIVAQKMWENDVEVSANGNGNKYINFSGGVFAANKNRQEFQTKVQEILKMFRFNQARYRWYKGESEYTYYTIYEGKDSELVTFK